MNDFDSDKDEVSFGQRENSIAEESIIYPPKYVAQPNPTVIWTKSLFSLALYLVLGYFIFKSFTLLLLITLIVIIHELGHFFAMKFFRYKDLGIFFIPLLGAYVSGTKREISQKESAIILLAGPLPGIVIGIGFYLLYEQYPFADIAGISYNHFAVLFIFLNLINLLPIYPLDGGQLLSRVFFNESVWLSRIFIFISLAVIVWFAISKAAYPLLFFPVILLYRILGDTKLSLVEKKLEASNINLDVGYEDLPDEDYWKIRDIIIEEHPSFKNVAATPPYEYDPNEERIMRTIQGLLHRHLIQDISLAGKLLIFIICILAIASPWLLKMDFLNLFSI